MPNPATFRERRLRMTKAQLIDEIDRLEQRATANDAAHGSAAPGPAAASRRELADLARVPSENPNPVLRVMPDGSVLYANDAAVAVQGLLTGGKEPVLARALAGICARASRTAAVEETEFESGDRVFAFSIAPIAGETYINIYGHDITARKRAEDKIAEKEAQLQIALDHMPGGMKLVDRDLNYVLVNAQYSELCGYPAGLIEAGGSMLDELRFQAERGDFGPGDAAKVVEEVLALYRSGDAARWERTLANGRRVEIQIAPTPKGGSINILTDITERKRGEQFLRTVVDTIPAALNIRDVDGRFVLINKSLADYFAIDSEDVIGKHPSEGPTPCPVDPREEEEFRQVIATGSAVVDIERQYETADGEESWLTTRQPIRDAVGQLQYVLTIAYEITQLRRTEKAARESRQFLGTLVDNIPAVVFFRDLDGRYIRVNRRYARAVPSHRRMGSR